MILLDTSVVIDYARGRDAKLQALVPKVPVAVCGVTRAEVLHGARDLAHRRNLAALLDTFAQVAIPNSLWDSVGDHLAALRSSGVTAPFQDVVHAAVAIFHDVDLWAHDAHFARMLPAMPQLRLFQEPP